MTAAMFNAQRIVHDHISVNNLLPYTINITPAMRRQVKLARQNYRERLQDKVKSKVSNEKLLKEKGNGEEIDNLKRRKTILMKIVKELHSDANVFVSQAETFNSIDAIK